LDKQGHFRANSTFVSPWIDGVTPFLYRQQRITFDGKILRSEDNSIYTNILVLDLFGNKKIDEMGALVKQKRGFFRHFLWI
jgi:hypothetical protein